MQDTMGFTVVGPDRFLGSGHPDQVQARDEGLPPLLGLIESTDGGKSWQTISLLAKRTSTFSAPTGTGSTLRRHERTLDAQPRRRANLAHRTAPSPLVDMAVNPSNLTHLVAAGQAGLWNWKPAGEGSGGLLAWPVPEPLYLVTDAGEARVRPNGGERWSTVGDIGGQPATLMAQTQRELYVALHDGTVKRFTDGGLTWSVRSAP